MRVCEKCKDYLYPHSTHGKYCARCKVASYCSVECQRSDWPRHKQECSRLLDEANANRVPQHQVYGRRAAAPTGGSSSSTSAGQAASGGSIAASAPAAAAGGEGASTATGSGSGSGTGTTAAAAAQPRRVRAMCGLCGGRKPPFLITECCSRVVCCDHDNYVLMTYERNSCARNHSRYSMCSTHHNERHSGSWKTCQRCRGNYDPYDYYTYGTNSPDVPSRSNFPDDVLDEPPPPLPCCAQCGRSVDTATEGHSFGAEGLTCMRCFSM